MIVTEAAKIEEVLSRGVAEILPSREGLEELLLGGTRIRLYQGFDPTGEQLHIGHMVGLRKLAQFQALGHEVIFLIGDGTGQAGDPSGKVGARGTFFTSEELRKNARDYVLQAGKIVRFEGENAASIRYNGEWLNALTLPELLNIAEQFTLQQLSDRDIFVERTKKGEAVNLREFLYPLLQGYDSVVLDVDLEIGATDQTFNMLVGRTLARKMKNKEKFVLTTPLLTDAAGRKIGKTEGNVIGITDEPHDMYGKIMALGDEVISAGLEYLTDVPVEEIKDIRSRVEKENPKQYKERLAFEVVKQLHGEDTAQMSAKQFGKVFGDGDMVPENIREVRVPHGRALMDVFVDNSLAPSKSEARRLMEAGGVRNVDTGEKLTDPTTHVIESVTLKIGKKTFVRLVV